MQYYDTGKYQVFFVLLLLAILLFNIIRAKGGKSLFIRRIAGLSAIDEAVGRSTEMGRPVLMVPGLSPLGPVGIQAVNIFAYITRTAVKFATPIRLCLADAALYSVAQEIIRDVYQSEGVPERYEPNSVRFVSDRQFAFAAGVAGLIHREKVAAAFLMGDWYAESLILAESANSVGAIQVAASTVTTQTPFLIAACDYVLIGDEFYAASAYLSREPVLVGSLVGQDWSKLVVVFVIVGLMCVSSIQRAFYPQIVMKVPGPDGALMAGPPIELFRGEGGKTTFRDADENGQTIFSPIEITPVPGTKDVKLRMLEKGQMADHDGMFRTKKDSETLTFKLFHPRDMDPVYPKRTKREKEAWEIQNEKEDSQK